MLKMRPLDCIYLLNPVNGQDPRAPNVLKTIIVFFINYIIANFKKLGGSTFNNQAKDTYYLFSVFGL